MIDDTTLNSEQREAVFSNHPRILCLAGAGTGKTQVLTHRIARLWKAGISPENMLALTFTRAAGAEMKERVIHLIGADGRKLFCNTFHAFCVEVIRDNAECLGYEPNFSVYDQQEADALLLEVVADLRYKVPTKKIAKARGGNFEGMTATIRKQAKRAWKEYNHRLKRNNAFDFDGLIETLRWALTEYPHIALHERYRYVFVDEFQDTDRAQWGIINRIQPQNVFAVGDDFQSIYGFRGSDISIILELARKMDWQTVKLERNYRSTLPIVTAANALIKHNQQTEKRLLTDKAGPEVEYREPEDDETELTHIIDRLRANQQLGQWKTTVILARTNRQLDRAKAILTAHNVPCETNAATDNPLADRSAKELLAWIAAIENPQDDTVIRKIAATKMGKADFLEAERVQLDGAGSFIDALRTTSAGLAFLSNFDEQSRAFISAQNVPMGVIRLQKNLGIENNGVAYQVTEWCQRQINLGESATAADLLAYVRLTNVADKPAKERDASKTYLMTVHGSKGLEFDEVFIIGAAQGTFPNRGDLEEERRLFYVAMTRAREYLNISCPFMMTDWNGSAKQTERSQFIGEAMNTSAAGR